MRRWSRRRQSRRRLGGVVPEDALLVTPGGDPLLVTPGGDILLVS